MDLRPSRPAMVEALKAAGVEFPESATLTQIRVLYEAVQKQENHADFMAPAIIDPDANLIVPADTRVTVKNSAVVTYAIAETDANTIASSDYVAAQANTDAVLNEKNEPAASAKIPEVSAGTAAAHAAVPNADTSAATAALGFNLSNAENELRNMQIRLEILKIQQQMRELEAREHPIVPARRIDLMELDSAIPMFNGDDHHDIVKWFVHFEDYVNICGYTEKEKCVGVRRRLDGTAMRYVNNLGLIEYEVLKSNLIRMFKRTVSRQEVYRQLRSRTLKVNETCLSYLVAMQSIAARSDIEEQELVDFIIDGIADNSNAITYLYGANTIEELIKRMDRYEQRRQQTHSGAAKNVANVNKPKSAVVSGKLDAKIPEAEVRCFNCSSFGHYQSRCQKPKRPPNSCFVCAEVGHFHQNCPKKKSLTAAIVDVEDLNAFQTSN